MQECVSNVADQFWVQTRNGLTLGAIIAMVALGYTMVYGVLQLINFAHSEVFMIATVVSFYAIGSWFDVTEPLTGGSLALVLIGSLIPAMLASGILAVLIERLAYRPLRRRGAPRLSFLISAIGASLAISYLFNLMDGQHYLLFIPLPNILGAAPRAIPDLVSSEPLFTFLGVAWTARNVLILVSAGVMLLVLDRIVRGTKLGRGIRSVAQDPETASLMGVNIDRVIVLTFFIGGLMAGAAGLLYAIRFNITAWNIGFIPGLKAFTAAVLGGIGNLRGAMLGGLLLGLVEAYGTACTAPHWANVISFLVLVGVLMFRPTGILGERGVA
jgi:branched-chain amino acid transport system permease protein